MDGPRSRPARGSARAEVLIRPRVNGTAGVRPPGAVLSGAGQIGPSPASVSGALLVPSSSGIATDPEDTRHMQLVYIWS